MSDQQIIDTYAARKMTIREMAKASGRSYEDVRRVLTNAGYHFSKKIQQCRLTSVLGKDGDRADVFPITLVNTCPYIGTGILLPL